MTKNEIYKQRGEEIYLLEDADNAEGLFNAVTDALERSSEGTKIRALLQEVETLAAGKVIKTNKDLAKFRKTLTSSEEQKQI